MSRDYVTLLGAEDVSTAGRDMIRASHNISSSAGTLDSSLSAFMQYMESWIERFENAVDRMEKRNAIEPNTDSVTGSAPEPTNTGEGFGGRDQD